MNVLIMDLGAERREKELHLQTLLSGLVAQGGTKLMLFCKPGSSLAALGEKYKIETILCKGTGLNLFFAHLKLKWTLRGSSTPWIMQCLDQQSLALALKTAAPKEHLNVIYAALLPESISNKYIFDNIHLLNAVVAETKEISDLMVQQGFLQSSTFVIPSALDATSYPAREERNDKRIIFACSAPLEEGRGYEQILQGMLKLYSHAEMPAWELRIAGGGSFFEDFLDRAKELGAETRLAIFGGFSSQDVLPKCDVLIAPAEQAEGNSLSIKEGWATGLAVLCSDIAAHRELVIEAQNGIFFNKENPDDLAEKMFSLATDEALRARLVKGGEEEIKKYSPEKMLAEHFALYQKILGK